MSSQYPRWSHEEVVVLLATLNFHIEEIREQFEKDKKSGIALAASLISPQLENCSANRISSKIQNLWHKHGPDGTVSDPIDPMYITGAWHLTLPKAYPKLLNDVNSRVVELMQAEQRSPRHRGNHSHNTRSTDTKDDEFPTRCKCGFVHYVGGFVLCEKCETWQHILCEYGKNNHNVVDEHHICVSCSPAPKPSLRSQESDHLISKDVEECDELFSKMLAKLQIQSKQNESSASANNAKKRRNLAKQAKSHSADINELITDDPDIFWGLVDESIIQSVSRVSSKIRKPARLLNGNEYVFRNADAGNRRSDLAMVLRYLGYSTEHYLELLEVARDTQGDSTFLLRALISAAIWKWSFEAEEDVQGSIVSILLGQYQNIILNRYGSDGLVAVQDVAWRSVVQECSHRTNEVLEQEANIQARRLFLMLSALVELKEPAPRSLNSIEDWTDGTTHGKEILQRLTEAFEVCIKQLRTRLPLARQWYELYQPLPGSQYDSQLMVDEGGILEKPEAKILLALSPAVIEYDMDTTLGRAHCNAFSAKDHFVHATSAEQREEGRVICKATVVLA